MADEEDSLPTIGPEDTTKEPTRKEELAQPIPGLRLVQKLGEGGMGEVFEAEQLEPVRRRVALKLIKRGMESKEVLARFESERQALALMSHPNIAQVFDAGTTADGRPYFVMELVKGVPVTKYCNVNRLTTAERLELFTQICNGVQHAHHKGVIHRDIKPTNVLVTIQDSRPVPKIIDFGVAKAIAQRLTEQTLFTAIGEFIGTPEYMSPEQAEMTELDIDTRTDVYSLGVVLYEMLVGAQPFDARELRQSGFDEMRRIIRDQDPPRPSVRLSSLGEDAKAVAASRRLEPSTLARQLHGDLDWITMKALEKDRTRRYDSPGELAADIGRHLRHEPVLAGPPSTSYRVKKFVRRHSIGVAASSIVVLALVLGIVGTTMGMIRAQKAERAASREAETAEQVSEFLVGLFEVSDPSETRGKTITAREILDKGADRISTSLSDQPIVRARLKLTIARVYEGLGLLDDAVRLAADALETRRQELGEEHLEVASAGHVVGDLQRKLGNYEDAETLLTQSAALHEELLGPVHEKVSANLNTLAVLYENWGRLAAAEEVYRRVQEIQEQDPNTDDAARSGLLTNLAVLSAKQGKNEEAEELFREVVAIDERTLGLDHPRLAVDYSNLGIMLKRRRSFDEAADLYRRALAIQEETLPPSHPSLGNTVINLANLAVETRDYPRALELYDRGRGIYEQALGPDHPSVALVLDNVGKCQRELGELDEADRTLRRALDIYEKALAPGSPEIGFCLGELALVQLALGRPQQARDLAQRALTIHEAALGSDDYRLVSTLHCLAATARDLGHEEQAVDLFRRALAIAEADPDLHHPDELSSLRSELAELE